MRLPFEGWVSNLEVMVASQPMRISVPKNEGMPFSAYPSPSASGRNGRDVQAVSVTAQSVEFVAKPGEAQKAQYAIAPALNGALKGVTGFAGCMVMTSDHEARLITVVTFWRGTERVKHCNANTRWVNALLAPYIDRRLRVQTMVAQVPSEPLLQEETAVLAEEESETCFA
jgi:hypothetical protein